MPTRQQGAEENWRASVQPVQKAENSCVFTTAETLEGCFFFFFFNQLPIRHLPFPSQPCGHKGSNISVSRIKCSIEPARHSIPQDTHSASFNEARKPLKLAMGAQFFEDIHVFSVSKTLPSPVQMAQRATCWERRAHGCSPKT